jgi:hypothetical protein
MKIRELRRFDCPHDCTVDHEHGLSDIPRILELFAGKGFECTEPNWERMGGVALVNDEGIIRMVAADRKTVEEYFLIDQSDWATPGMKWHYFERLHEAERRSLLARGYEDVHAFIPPIWRSFARRLGKVFGWVNSLGPEGKWFAITRDL